MDDTTEEERFEEKYFEVKITLKRYISDSPNERAAVSLNEDAILQLLQQQSEMIQYLGRDRNVHDRIMPAITVAESASENESLAAIIARQTEVLDRVTSAAGSHNGDNRVKLPTIKLPQFDGKIEEWKCFADSFRSIIHVATV